MKSDMLIIEFFSPYIKARLHEARYRTGTYSDARLQVKKIWLRKRGGFPTDLS